MRSEESLLDGAAAWEFLDLLVDKECWAIIAGAGTGSMVMMHFGEKIPLDKRVRNSKLSEDARNFDGEYTVFVQFAAWEILHADELVCNCYDDNTEGGDMLAGLDELLGKKVLRARMNAATGNFAFDFPGDLRLNVYCDDLDDDDCCYSFFVRGKHIGTAMCKAAP